MARNRAKQRANKKLYKALQRENECVSPFRPDGTADYTTFSALTGKDKISKATLTDCKHRANGSFNG